jgi:ClpP class serine protease
MDKNVILERLMRGEDAEAIAKEFTDMLNEANREYAEKKEAVQMKEELQDIIDMFMEWLNRYYEIPSEREVCADEVIDLIDGLKEYAAALSAMQPILKKTTADNYDEVLEEFLKGMKW